MTLKEIATRIDAHLKRFEQDKEINRYKDSRSLDGLHPYWRAGAWVGGRYVRVCYISYQGTSALTKQQAEQYLAWLDAGNVGSHWKCK